MLDKDLLGKKGEEIALKLFENKGYSLVKKNFRTRLGEIDLIVKKDNELIFCEVKTRKTIIKGKPYENVTLKKLKHLKKAIDIFLKSFPKFENYQKKIMVVSILLKENQSEIEIFEV